MPVITSTRQHDGWLVLSVQGEIDIYTVPQLRTELADAMSAAATAHPAARAAHTDERSNTATVPVRGVVVDLEAVTFMDSAGLGVLINAHKRAAAISAPLRLAAATDQLGWLFKITGVDQVLDLRPSVEEACRSAV